MRYSTPTHQKTQFNLPQLPGISAIKENDASAEERWYHIHSASVRKKNHNSAKSWTQTGTILKMKYSNKIDLLSGVNEQNDMSPRQQDLSQLFDDEANKSHTPTKKPNAKDSAVKPDIARPELNYDEYLKKFKANLIAIILQRADILYIRAPDIIQTFHRNDDVTYFHHFGMILMHEVVKMISLIQDMKNALFPILFDAIKKNQLNELWILDTFMDKWCERTTATISVESELLLEVLIKKMVQTELIKQQFDDEKKKIQSAQKNKVNVSIFSHPYVSVYLKKKNLVNGHKE
eukprot:155216_1